MMDSKKEAKLCGKWLLIGAAYGVFILAMFQLEQIGAFEWLKNLEPVDWSDYPWDIWWMFWLLLS